MRLIDADKLRKDVIDLPNAYNGFSDTYDKAMIVDIVDEQPTVDAEPIRHGHWIDGNDSIIVGTCSVCGWSVFIGETNISGMPYCPNCGAKMDEEEEQWGDN